MGPSSGIFPAQNFFPPEPRSAGKLAARFPEKLN
jgi:hypothetical protein